MDFLELNPNVVFSIKIWILFFFITKMAIWTHLFSCQFPCEHMGKTPKQSCDPASGTACLHLERQKKKKKKQGTKENAVA